MSIFGRGNEKENTTDEVFSSIDLIAQCLSDSERTAKIIETIQKTVQPGDVVLDSGTGSAILAMAAAQAGAKKVLSIEIDSYVAKLARENIRRNGLQDVVEVIEMDARTASFEKEVMFNVVVMEMLTTGMIDEHQVRAINNLHQQGVVNEHTRFVPQRQDTFVTLSEKDFLVAGFNVRMVRHLWLWLPDAKPTFLSEQKTLNSISFNTTNALKFNKRVSFTATASGTVNSLYFSSKSVFADESALGDTLALNGPVVFPLEEDISVLAGDVVELEISYVFGGGFQSLVVKKI